MPLSTGQRLGPYEILSPAGAGGMGEVYRERDTRLDRIVAIKVLPAHVASDPDLRQRFEREARAVSSLNHPHICALYDIGHQDGMDFLVLEYLEGETLADRLAKGPLSPEQVLRTAGEIAGARQGTPAEPHPPRLEAGQRHSHEERRQAPRFRPGQAPGPLQALRIDSVSDHPHPELVGGTSAMSLSPGSRLGPRFIHHETRQNWYRNREGAR